MRSPVQLWLSAPLYGCVAQLARAFGSYPECRRFESTYRYHNGPVVKRLRHGPFTAVTRVRFPSGSPDKKRRRQGAFFIGGPQSQRPEGKSRNRQERQQTAAVLPAFLFFEGLPAAGAQGRSLPRPSAGAVGASHRLGGSAAGAAPRPCGRQSLLAGPLSAKRGLPR